VDFSSLVVYDKKTDCRFSLHLCVFKTEPDVSLKIFTHNPPRTPQRVYLLPLRHRGKFTALFLADNTRKLAVIPIVEMCQLLMGLSKEMAFPEDLWKIDTVVLTVTPPTSGLAR